MSKVNLDKLSESEQELYMLCEWASKLVGNKHAFDQACAAWQKSFLIQKHKLENINK